MYVWGRGKGAVNLLQRYVNFILNYVNIVDLAFLAFRLATQKGNKISLVNKLTVWHLKVELDSLYKLKFYLSVLLSMRKMSQPVCKKVDIIEVKINILTLGQNFNFFKFSFASQFPRHHQI